MELIRGLPFGVLVLGFLIFIGLSATVGTFAINTSTLQLALTKETLITDSSVNATFLGIQTTQGGGLTDNGTPCTSSIEAVTGTGDLKADLVKFDLEYRVDIREATPSSWGATALYRVELFDDTSTLLATRYFDNSANDDSNEEGVTLRVGLGSTTVTPDVFTTIITLIADCSGE